METKKLKGNFRTRLLSLQDQKEFSSKEFNNSVQKPYQPFVFTPCSNIKRVQNSRLNKIIPSQHRKFSFQKQGNKEKIVFKHFIQSQRKKSQSNQSREKSIFIKKTIRNQRVKTEGPQSQKEFNLSSQQMTKFGNQRPKGYRKIQKLGSGGFAIVWLFQEIVSQKLYAVKQIRISCSYSTHQKQIQFSNTFFQNGEPRAQFQNHPGIQVLIPIRKTIFQKNYCWLFYTKQGISLGSGLYDLRSQKIDNQRYFKIRYKELYKLLRRQPLELQFLVKQLASALDLINQKGLIHSDLKTQNILVKTGSSGITQVKLIDYGSSFNFKDLKEFSMATPQYMSPQILNYILFVSKLQYDNDMMRLMQNYNNASAIDVWSLGCVILQIVSGLPLWMSIKTIIFDQSKNTEEIRTGLFAVKGRVFNKIIEKQIKVAKNLDFYLQHFSLSGIKLSGKLKYALSRMLDLNPNKRIKPRQITDILK